MFCGWTVPRVVQVHHHSRSAKAAGLGDSRIQGGGATTWKTHSSCSNLQLGSQPEEATIFRQEMQRVGTERGGFATLPARTEDTGWTEGPRAARSMAAAVPFPRPGST